MIQEEMMREMEDKASVDSAKMKGDKQADNELVGYADRQFNQR